MIRLQRYHTYIAQQLGLVTLVVALSLTSIIWLLQALRFVDYIVNRGVSIGTFLHLTALMLPSLLVMIVPVALMVAAVFVYARLMQDSELVVFFSAGLSRWQLAQPLVGMALVAMALLYALTLVVVPRIYTEFKDMQIFLRDNYAALLLQEEVFNSPVEGLTVFVRSRTDQGLLRGILVHDNRDAAKPVTMMAQQAVLMQTPAGPRFILQRGSRQQMSEGRMSILHFDRYPLDLNFYNANAKRQRKSDEMSLKELADPGSVSGDDYGKRMAELHRRLTWPPQVLAMSLLALAMLIRGEFNRRNHGRRMGTAAIVALVPLAVALLVENVVSNSPALGWVMYANIALALGGSVVLMRHRLPAWLRADQWRDWLRGRA